MTVEEMRSLGSEAADLQRRFAQCQESQTISSLIQAAGFGIESVLWLVGAEIAHRLETK
jgi:hypothetical protein